jgi:tetratricopeptide (TPR) repeat protein
MASLIPGFEYDIFISYRQKDNKGDRWVTEFVTALKTELEATFKDEITIYFDENPHDGLLETHDVGASLKDKLRCLIFIPVISRTYCDSRSFAWEHELVAFVEEATKDRFGLKVRLPNSNIASRVLPVRIHDLTPDDKKICEETLGGMLRSVDFIYRSPGVNRPLRANEDHPHDNMNKVYYRDQINKTANAIDEIIQSLKVIHLYGVSDNSGFDQPVNPDDFALSDKVPKAVVPVHNIKPLELFHKSKSTELTHHKKFSYQYPKKYIYTALILLPLVAIIFGWNDLTRFIGPGKAKREQSVEHSLSATSLFKNGDLEGAKREVALALANDPGNASAWTTLSAVSFKQGDKKKAIEQTLEALKLDPQKCNAAYNLALSFEDTGDKQQAIEWYSKTIKIDSSKVPAYSALGNLYNQMKQTADAVLILSLAEKKYPDSEFMYLVHKNLGNSYLLMQQYSSAIKYLELSIAAKPDLPETNQFLAMSYESSGEIVKSIDYWQKYISFETDSAKTREARSHLKEITVKHLQDILK